MKPATILLLGSSFSGTTMLSNMLGACPEEAPSDVRRRALAHADVCELIMWLGRKEELL
jgi:hypothetical protein